MSAGEQWGHHDPAEPMVPGPVDVLDRELNVVKGYNCLAGPAAGNLRAEVGEPPVVSQAGLTIHVRISREADALARCGVKWQPIGEENLGHHPLAFHVVEPPVRVPLRRGVDTRAEAARFGCSRFLLCLRPPVEEVQVPLLDVVAVSLTRGPDVPVYRNDRRSLHRASLASESAWILRPQGTAS